MCAGVAKRHLRGAAVAKTPAFCIIGFRSGPVALTSAKRCADVVRRTRNSK